MLRGMGFKLTLFFFFFFFFEKKGPVYPPFSNHERVIIELPSNQSIKEYLRYYTSEAHLAGTENDKRQAEWTRDQFQKFGLNATIETYWPLLTYPQGHRLAMISGPEHLRFEAKLTEGIIDEDETSKNPDNVPTFHGYSKNGTVTGRVVYANYGRREDFQYLVDRGINLNGTIALVRYGGAYRGLKVKAAEMYGCIGALVYSDPSDDGPLNKEGYPYIHPAEEYPNGPWRPKSSVQRGSVMFLSDGCGDPLTEGHPATENATRIRRDDSKILPKIPSLPLSWEDALPLLRATEGLGLNGGDDWLGGSKDVNYYSGPTEGEVILTNHVEDKITPVWNVIGRIEGAEEPERSIILGNHRGKNFYIYISFFL
jgi:N-acetylated-alpha-linked acidic dipeptidase